MVRSDMEVLKVSSNETGKSPSAVLRFIFSHCLAELGQADVLLCTPQS